MTRCEAVPWKPCTGQAAGRYQLAYIPPGTSPEIEANCRETWRTVPACFSHLRIAREEAARMGWTYKVFPLSVKE